jgi:hypothetical protein
MREEGLVEEKVPRHPTYGCEHEFTFYTLFGQFFYQSVP